MLYNLNLTNKISTKHKINLSQNDEHKLTNNSKPHNCIITRNQQGHREIFTYVKRNRLCYYISQRNFSKNEVKERKQRWLNINLTPNQIEMEIRKQNVCH